MWDDYESQTWEYNDDGSVKSWTKENKNVGSIAHHKYYYNERGQLRSDSQDGPYGYKILWSEYSYDENDRLNETKWTIESEYSIYEDNVYITTYEYDEQGFLVSEQTKKESGKIAEYEIYDDNLPGWHVDHISGNCEVNYTYQDGKLVEKEQIVKSAVKRIINSEYEYYDSGTVSRITKIEEVNDQYTDYFVTVFLFDEEGLLQYEDIFYNYNGSGPINYNSPSWRMIYEYYYE